MATLTVTGSYNWSDLEDTTTSSFGVHFAAKSITCSFDKAFTNTMPLALYCQDSKLMTVLAGTVTSYTGSYMTFTPTAYGSTLNNIGCVASMWGRFAYQAFSSQSRVLSSTGSYTFQIRPNLPLEPGDPIRAVNRATQTNFMQGTVVNYTASSGIMVMTSSLMGGSGTVSDWMFVSAGTSSNWIIAPNDNDVISVAANATLTIDKSNYSFPTRLSALSTGNIQCINSSSITPIVLRISRSTLATGFGRIEVSQNATFYTSGGFITLATGSGNELSCSFDTASWAGMSMPTYVEVETASGSGVFERWGVFPSQYYGMGRYGYVYGADISGTPTNLAIDSVGGGTGIATVTFNGGTGYTNGFYSNVPLIGGTGTGSYAHITVAGGVVSAFYIANAGDGYTVNNIVSCSTAFIGGTSTTRFSASVATIGIPAGTYKVSGGSGQNGIATVGAVSTSAIGRPGTFSTGSGYTDGTYLDIPIKATSGTGRGARANITVFGGKITSMSLSTGGVGYGAGNTFTIGSEFLGGTGTGFASSVATLASGISNVYFSGFTASASPYQVGDKLTLLCTTGSGFTSSINPVVRVLETSDFSGNTPATNILSSVVVTTPLSASYYGDYHVYSCSGGTGTNALYSVITYNAAVGTQGGYFVSGSGYSIDDILTVGSGGLQIKITEVRDVVSASYNGKVCTWDEGGMTLRFGDGVSSLAVPQGAIVRVPNIVVDALPLEAPTTLEVNENNTTFTFENAICIGDFPNNNTGHHVDYESMGATSRTSNTIVVSRGQRGTYPNSHAAGSIVRAPLWSRVNNVQRAQFLTTAGGGVDCKNTMFGIWLFVNCSGTRLFNFENCGWTGQLLVNSTTGPATIKNCSQAGYPFWGADYYLNLSAVQNSLSVSGTTFAQSTYNNADTNQSFIAPVNCPSITKLSDLTIMTVKEWRGDRRHISLSNSSFINDTTSIPQNIRIFGGKFYASAQASHRITDIWFGSTVARTLSPLSVASAYSYIGNASPYFDFTNCSNLIVHNFGSVDYCQPIKGDITNLDAGCSNLIFHTITGSGAWGGIGLTNRIMNSTALNVKIANLSFGNLRTPYSHVANTIQTSNQTQNVRTNFSFFNQNATIVYISSSLVSTGNGIGHGSVDSVDFVTGYTPYWTTAGGMTPNLPDASWFMNLVDNGLYPTTGRISIGCGGPNSSYTQYIVSGSPNTYTDNGGRLYVGQADDSIELTNRVSIRGITGFQSIDPVGAFSRTGTSLQSWYSYTITNGGTGYTVGSNPASVSGGSGYGGAFSFSQGSGIINAGNFTNGIGYQVGDVVTVLAGNSDAQLTITGVKNFYVRMCPWGQNITSVIYSPLTYTDLQSQFSSMVGYDSNKGLQLQVKITADSNPQDTTSYMNFLELFTTVDPTFSPPIGYVDLTFDSVASGSIVLAYSGSSLVDSEVDINSGTASLSVPYNYNGTVASANVKLRCYGYNVDDYVQTYGKDGASKTAVPIIDTKITEFTSSIISSSTITTNVDVLYDKSQFYLTQPAGYTLSKFASAVGTQVDFGAYNLIFNSSASSALTVSSSNITINTIGFNSGSTFTSTKTTGTASFISGAYFDSVITDYKGTTGLLIISNIEPSSSVALYNSAGNLFSYEPTSSNVHKFYIPAGSTGSWEYKIANYAYEPLYTNLTVNGGGYFNIDGTQTLESFNLEPSRSVVDSYTEIETLSKLHDTIFSFQTTPIGIKHIPMLEVVGSTLDLIDYNLVVNSSASIVFSASSDTITIKAPYLNTSSLFSKVTTTGTITAISGAYMNTSYTDAVSSFVPIEISGLIAGSKVQIYNVTDAVEMDNVIVSGTTYYRLFTYTSNKTLRLRVVNVIGTTAYDNIETTGILTSLGATFIVSPTSDSVYNGIGVDGTTVPEFSADYPNVQVDISDGDGVTTIQRLYAWYRSNEMTTSGIANFFNGLMADDAVNFQIDISIINLLLDNVSASPVMVGGGRLYRSDNSTVIAATSNSIQMDPSKAYLASSQTIENDLIAIKNNAVLIPALL